MDKGTNMAEVLDAVRRLYAAASDICPGEVTSHIISDRLNDWCLYQRRHILRYTRTIHDFLRQEYPEMFFNEAKAMHTQFFSTVHRANEEADNE